MITEITTSQLKVDGSNIYGGIYSISKLHTFGIGIVAIPHANGKGKPCEETCSSKIRNPWKTSNPEV